MPFDGNGNFTRTFGPDGWQNDAAAGIKIRADLHDTNDDDLAQGLSQVICKDGQSSPTADITLNGHKLINVANPTSPQDAATKASSEAIRDFSTAIFLTGTSTGVSPNFVSRALVGYVEADMSLVGRKADPAAVPPTKNRLAFNDKADGTGTDVVVINDDGTMTGVATGTVIERVYDANATWTKPLTGFKSIKVRGQGPGGGSCGVPVVAANQQTSGGGAGAGSYGERTFLPADLPNATYPITIAAGGAAGNSTGTAGGDGGTSSFGTLCTFPGGKGAPRGGATAQLRVDGGGQSNSPTGCDLAIPGQQGDATILFFGGSATNAWLGAGGRGFWGDTYAQNAWVGTTAANTPPGGWGSGARCACNIGAVAAQNGATGGASRIIVTEYY